MSVQDADDFLSVRPGQIACVCGPLEGAADDVRIEALWRLSFGFGLSVLAQALVLSVLPEASRLLAPSFERTGWPFALLLIGAALASFPAAFLIDAFGRRSAFALGASLGIAGGLLACYAIMKANFPALCLGAFWLGLAQGFALFYRHASALGASGGAIIFSGGALAAFIAPLAMSLTGGDARVTLVGAAALHVLALALSVRLPHALHSRDDIEAAPSAPGAGFLIATLIGALAWFLMAAAMLRGPLALSLCSAAPAFIGGAVAWHLLAMYGPAALAARWPIIFSTSLSLIGGLAIMLSSSFVLMAAKSEMTLAIALIAVGVGWALANVGALRLLHAQGRPPRLMLALHDLCLLGAAAAGALAL
jgi:MFS family permease